MVKTMEQIHDTTLPIFQMILTVVLFTKLDMWLELVIMVAICVLVNIFVWWWTNVR